MTNPEIMSLRAERTIKMKNGNRRFMKVAFYKIERGERLSDTATIDNLVTKIEIEEDHYKVTTLKDIWSGEEIVLNIPTDKYEIVINKFNYC